MSNILHTSNGQPIVVIAQEADPTNKAADIKNYEGFNLQ